ncbi:olfactory receptor 52K1-like [Salarias fasciatus]|uniref:olfactory receptor 52K1-like n=1 Tax=Salarias fasciatus TaxID=181472 RepID=UPI0011766716|nr:olfactory receptor 52K1-like [Salarias fasciatus]
MDNTTSVTAFKLTAYESMDKYKHGMFCVFFLLYLAAVVLNSLLISVVHMNPELHHPMNVFACMLSVNEMYGSTALLPAIMALLISETHEVSAKWCSAQVYFLHTYAGGEFCILALMGYDRYVAICYPLHYHTNMSKSKICKLIALAGLYSLIVFGCFYSLTLQLRFCGKVIPKLYCVNMELVKNACSTASYISIAGLSILPLFVVPQLVMIILSYAKIAKVCSKLTKEAQIKALKTCIPHLFSLLNYSIGSCFEIVQTRLNMTHVSVETRSFLSLYFVIMPAISNPVMYGLGIQLVRVYILKLFFKYTILPKRVGSLGTVVGK